MGAGFKNNHINTNGYCNYSSSDIVYRSEDVRFFDFANKRKNKDYDGYIDILAHGGVNLIQIMVNGNKKKLSPRDFSRLVKHNKKYNNQPIRLLSCNTGYGEKSFAQNLANKLNVKVLAPTKYCFAFENGTIKVFGSLDNGKTPN